MDAKTKAQELLNDFVEYCDGTNCFESYEKGLALKNAKHCALIVVNEIIEAIQVFHNGPDHLLHDSMGWEYWKKVKEEINAL